MSDDEFSEVVFCSEKCRKQFGIMESPMAPLAQPPASMETDHTVLSTTSDEISSIKVAELKEEVKLEITPPQTNISSENMVAQQKPIKLSISIGPQQNAVTIVSGPALTSNKNKRMLKHKPVDSIDEDKVL